MRRALALLLIAAAMAGSGPCVALLAREAGAEVCPMMMHPMSAAPCIGVPCPCEHGPDAAIVIESSLTPPGAVELCPPMLTGRSRAVDPSERLTQGFPWSLDRPPSLHA